MKTIWKGSISFGLVNIPINIYAATKSHVLGFTLLHAKCDTPLNYHRWCSACKKEVAWNETVKGLKVGGSYIILTQEKLKKLRPEKTETIKIVEFIETESLDTIYFDHHYYVGSKKSDDTAYALFVKALEKLNKVAIGRFIMRDKEYTCALQPYKDRLLLTTLHYSYEIKNIQNVIAPSKVKIDAKELKLAQELINKLSVKTFDMGKFKDTFAQEIKKLLKTKGKKKKVVAKKGTKKEPQKKPSLAQSLHASLEHIERPSARA